MKTLPQTYELMKDEESMNLIKIQNKKINTLINQLEQKESTIKQYESKLFSMTKATTVQNSAQQNNPSYYQTPLNKPSYQSIETDEAISPQYETITHSHIPDSKQREAKMAKLVRENNYNSATIQKLNDTVMTQNNKIDALLTRITDFNSVISNQENTIGALNKSKASIEKKRNQEKQLQDNLIQKFKDEIDAMNDRLNEREKVNRKIMKDNELFNAKFEEMNKKIKELIEENKNLKGKHDKKIQSQQENELAIQNYESKLNQYEYLLNSKDNYHQEYIHQIENIADKYSQAINQAIEWGKNNIGISGGTGSSMGMGMGIDMGMGMDMDMDIKGNACIANDNRGECLIMSRANSSTNANANCITDIDYGRKLKMIYDNIVNMTTSLNKRIKEQHSQHEKELHQQQNHNAQYKDQISEMSNHIHSLEQELNQLRDQSDDQESNFALNESYMQKWIESLNAKLQQYEVNADLMIKEFKRQLRETLPTSQGNDSTVLFPIHNSIDPSKESNGFNTIELLFNQLTDYCKWLVKDNQLKQKLKNENEMLYDESQRVIDENMQLKRTIQSNGKQFNAEKMELLNQLNSRKNNELYEREKSLVEERGLLKEYIANHEEESERMKSDYSLLKNQYSKLEKAYEDLKKNQKQYEEHLLLQNEEMQHKCKELEEKNMKLHTDIEIGNMQLAKLKNALQEQIEQTRETLTNYSTSI